MIHDFEYLYMIRQRNVSAFTAVSRNYERLIWKRAHTFFNEQRPDGINVEDLYQEGLMGFYSSLYTFSERRRVGFAYYVSLCVESHIRTALRRCRGKSYRLLDSKYSLDASVFEDETLSLYDISSKNELKDSPSFMAIYEEAKGFLDSMLSTLPRMEVLMYHLQEEGYSYKEIAFDLQVSEKKVDNTIQKIRKLIKLMN